LKPRHAVLLAVAMSPHILFAAPAKLLDALRYEESWHKIRVINHNRNGTRDLGPFQLNEKYLPDYAWRYNKGKTIDPFDYKQARFIANAHLDHLQRTILTGYNDCGITVYLGRWEGVTQAWNCGLTRYMHGAPKTSIDFAARVIKRAGMRSK
jgi:hypothetical protein